MTDDEARDFAHGLMRVGGGDLDHFVSHCLTALADREALAHGVDMAKDRYALCEIAHAARRHMEGK